LLFHPREHRLTLTEIKAFLAANDLQFEQGCAGHIGGMYQFALRKPPNE